MKNATQSPGSRSDDIERVRMGLPFMNNKRFPCFSRNIQLPQKHLLLHRAGRKVIVIIQTDFTDCHDLGVGSPSFELQVVLFPHIFCIMRMHSNGSIYAAVFFHSKAMDRAEESISAPDIDDQRHSRSRGSCDYQIAVPVKSFIIDMGV